MCPCSAIHVRGRRHRQGIVDKALELDAGDGGPLEWRGGVSFLGCEGIGMQALARDLGSEIRLIIHVDSCFFLLMNSMHN